MIGGGRAGLFGGLLYGFAASSQSLESGMGATSVLLVLVCVTILVGLAAGAGVGFDIAAAGFAARRAWLWYIIGGASGGMIVGALAKLIGLDAFSLLLGQSPGDITGAAEGAVLGGAVGLGVWLGMSSPGPSPLRRNMLPAALAGGLAGAIIPLLGGRLMGGSLDLLVRVFPQSRLRLDQISGLFSESGFGTVSQVVTGGIEGMIFGSFVAGAIFIALNRGYVTSRPNYNH